MISRMADITESLRKEKQKRGRPAWQIRMGEKGRMCAGAAGRRNGLGTS